MSSTAARLLERIQSRRARVGVVGLGYVGLPLAVEFARAASRGRHRSRCRKIARDHARRVATSLTSPRPTWRAGRGRPLERHLRLQRRRRPRHDQHLRADAAPQDAKTRTCVHRLRGRGDRRAPATGHARHPRVDDLSRGRPRKSCSRCSSGTGSRPATISSWPSRLSASIPGNAKFNTRNMPKVVGGMTPGCLEARAGAVRDGDGQGRAGQLAASRRRW